MDIQQALNQLYRLSINENLSIYERSAINEAIMAIEHNKRIEGDQVDFQGWPIDKLTMKELREFVKENEKLPDDTKLKVYQDDGMGYGANNGYCSELYVSNDEEDNAIVQIWF